MATKTGAAYGSFMDLLTAIPNMGVTTLHQLDKGLTMIDVKTTGYLDEIITNSIIDKADMQAIACQDKALSFCQGQEAHMKAIDPTFTYDMARNCAAKENQYRALLGMPANVI